MKDSTKKAIEKARRNPQRDDRYEGEEFYDDVIIPVFRFVEYSGHPSDISGKAIIMRYEGTMEFSITIGEDGKKPAVVWQIQIDQSGSDYSSIAKRCVERLLLREHIYMTPKIYDVDLPYRIDYSRMIYDFSDAPEPWKTFFTDLFKDSNWTIQKLIDGQIK